MVARSGENGAPEEIRTSDPQVRSLGGEPAQSGSISGSMHRAWTNIKSSITGMDEYAVLGECERGEDVAKHVYEEALNEDLPQTSRHLSNGSMKA